MDKHVHQLLRSLRFGEQTHVADLGEALVTVALEAVFKFLKDSALTEQLKNISAITEVLSG